MVEYLKNNWVGALFAIGFIIFLSYDGCVNAKKTGPRPNPKTAYKTCVECRGRFTLYYYGEYPPSRRLCDDCLNEHIMEEKDREEDMRNEYYKDLEAERSRNW